LTHELKKPPHVLSCFESRVIYMKKSKYSTRPTNCKSHHTRCCASSHGSHTWNVTHMNESRCSTWPTNRRSDQVTPIKWHTYEWVSHMTIYTCDHRHTYKMPHMYENLHIQNATHLRCHTYEKVEMKHLIHEPQKPLHVLSCFGSRVIYTNFVRAVCITNISKKTPQLIFGTQTCFFFRGGCLGICTSRWWAWNNE